MPTLLVQMTRPQKLRRPCRRKRQNETALHAWNLQRVARLSSGAWLRRSSRCVRHSLRRNSGSDREFSLRMS